MEKVSFVFIFIILGVSAVQVEYLKMASRLDAPHINDYYFCCNVMGRRIVWEVNKIPIGGFDPGLIPAAIVNAKSNYNYSITLLSSREMSSDVYSFDSVLIVSLPDDSTIINVTCYNHLEGNTTSNRDPVVSSSSVLPMVHKPVALNYILRRNIVLDNLVNTSIFLCAAAHTNLLWQITTPMNTRQYAFDIGHPNGENRFQLASDQDTVELLAILIANENNSLTSVLFVTDPLYTSVRCLAGGEEVQLSSSNVTEFEGNLNKGKNNQTTEGNNQTTEGNNQTTEGNMAQSNEGGTKIMDTLGASAALPRINVMMIAVLILFSALWGVLL